MLDSVTAILHLRRAGDGVAVPEVLHGTLPDGLNPTVLAAACGDKPGLRKFAGGLVVVLPEGPTAGKDGGDRAWVAWVLDQVPPVTALPDLVERLARVTRDLRATVQGAAPQAPPDATIDLLALLAPRIAGSDRRKPAVVRQMIADACIETGLARAAAVMMVTRGKAGQAALSDTRLAPYSDEIRHLVASRLDDAPAVRDFPVADLAAEGLDGALLAEMAGAGLVRLDLPAQDAGGLALVLFDPGGAGAAPGRALDALAAIASHKRPPRPFRRKALRAATLVAGLALLVWLSLPAPLVVTATAVSEPSRALALSLPVGGFAETVSVRVGDRVAPGDPIARFRAPELEEQRAALGIEIAVETVAAQSALSTNDYAAFLLSQQKVEAATARLSRLEDRLAAMTLTAPDGGRIVAAMGADVTGRYFQLGETVAILQPEAQFALLLTVSRVDAPLLQSGQTGEVWFRGLSGRTWRIETETPVSLQRDPQGGADRLTLRARLTDADQQALFAGLAGFARIETGRDIRARVLGRYVIEFIRSKSWIWFGLTF